MFFFIIQFTESFFHGNNIKYKSIKINSSKGNTTRQQQNYSNNKENQVKTLFFIRIYKNIYVCINLPKNPWNVHNKMCSIQNSNIMKKNNNNNKLTDIFKPGNKKISKLFSTVLNSFFLLMKWNDTYSFILAQNNSSENNMKQQIRTKKIVWKTHI